ATLAYTIRIFAEIYRRKGRELERLSVRLLSAQEEERRRIARQLHDELGQALTVAKLDLELVGREVPEGLQGRLREGAQLLDKAIAEVRELSHSLRPPLVDELGLAEALRALSERFAAAENLKIELEAEGLGGLPPEVESLVYRTAQEALTNAARHAEARRIDVRLSRSGDRLRLEVVDDGRGFDPREAARGLGLRGARERAMLAGGSLRIESRPGTGTRLILEVPLR
ncbi:MAG: sensor histidine kinase, partial [Candidatus Bipolaricaulia bacterium]